MKHREPQQFYSQGRAGQPPADGFLAGQAENGDLLDMAGTAGGSFVNVGTKEAPIWQRRVAEVPADGAPMLLVHGRVKDR
jgi:hypothetical protein